MSDNGQNSILPAEVPEELHEWYYQEIDSLLSESRAYFNLEGSPFKSEKKGRTVPILINILLIAVAAVCLIIIFAAFGKQEKKIIANYNLLNPVEGRILSAYKKQTEKKLAQLNSEISNIEGRLEGVTKERNTLLAEIDNRVAAREKELELKMRNELDLEREQLIRLGLPEASIQSQINRLEEANKKAMEEARESLKKEIEAEYKTKDDEYNALLAEYEKSKEERNSLETELASTNLKIITLSEKLSDAEEPAAAPDTETAGSTETEKNNAVTDQINSMYRQVYTNIENGRYAEALSGLDKLKQYLENGKLADIPALKMRKETDLLLISSIKSLLSSSGIPAPASGVSADTSPEKSEKLLASIRALRDNFDSYFAGRKNSLSAVSSSKLIELLEVKVQVKDILSREPFASEYPGLYSRLEEYYEILGNDQETSGRVEALQNVLEILKAVGNSGSGQGLWNGIEYEDVKKATEDIISQLEQILE